MEGKALYLVAALLVCFPAPSHSQLFSLITPSVLRIDSEEQVVVEAHGLNAEIEVTITVLDFPHKRNNFYWIKASLKPENGMIATPFIKLSARDLKKDSRKKTYVVVHAISTHFSLEKVVLVSYQMGYIFIQTDKTIYTPGSPVRYRIFSVGHNMERLDKHVVVEIVTPEDIIVSQKMISSAVARTYNIPELVSLGTWKVVAKYQDSPEESFSTPFEVKEYVLPSFEVVLEPAETFYYIDSNRDFKVSITATFLYGEKVEGVAFVLFGVKIDNDKKSIPDSLRRTEIVKGKGEAVLTRAMLQSRFRNPVELVGHSLYVSVTMMTDSGSDMVMAEKSDISIVTSPYQIHFTKNPKYFKPSMPYGLTVYVTNPDGSPAARVPVVSEPLAGNAVTQNDGIAKLVLNMPGNAQELRITVKTNHERLPKERQATNSMVARPYQTQAGSENYLHLAVSATELKAGDDLHINFNLRSNNQDVLNGVTYLTYIILTKGKILRAGRQPRRAGQNLVTMSLRITPDFIPSFRVLAYYPVGNNEIVADSVWVDVKDTCMGTLIVKGATETDEQIQEPSAPMEIKVEGDANATVGLVAVDKGVYVLNKKYKLTQSKIWNTVEKNDIGCTAGSGMNNLGVFEDAGLTLETSNKLSTKLRSDAKCPQAARRRRRRSVQLIESKASKVAEYQDQRLRKCCEDGMHENPMGYTCEKRTEYIEDQNECQAAFLECCRYIKGIRDAHQREDELILARSAFEDEYSPDEDIVSRTEFPESWLWETKMLNETPNDEGISSKIVRFSLKDSITTWEVLAVSISKTKGICVAEPYEIKVMKKFFIDLRVPYSVVRNEQVEIRAVLYNYGNQDIRVRVELMHNPAFCSSSTAKQRYRQEIRMTKQSSRVMPLVIVPLELGIHDIEVKAAVWGMMVSDGVKKKLKVVPEGMQRKLVTVVDLDPETLGKGGVQKTKVTAKDLSDIVPGTEPEMQILVQGDPVAHIVEDSIDGTNLKHLIITPSGCGEQNMITMTPSVIATHYLDTTGQWEKIGVDRRAVALNQIMQGYAQQLPFKKRDNSYAAFPDRKSSTWLTAYVVKVFAMASRLVSTISTDVLCGGVKWLVLERQKPDGIFQEDAPVIHGEMLGGYEGAEPEVSLTAFVLVALLESKEMCSNRINILDNSIRKTVTYLSRKYDTLQRPYTTALTAYALALAGQLNDDRVLMAASTGGNRWEENGAHTYNIEGTSYGLLALLKMKKFEATGPIVKWLVAQKYYGGTYGQTQATIMVFQALAQYEIDVPTHKDLNLDVSVQLSERSGPIRYRINYSSALLARTTETKLNQNFTVEASGQGKATMTVLTVYNAMMQENTVPCKKFNLNVTVETLQLNQKELKGALGAVKIKICTRYLGEVDATMTIIDVSMLTGFAPDIDELKKLSEGTDRYISKFEVDQVMSERGKLIIYLDKVSHSKDECLVFKAFKYFEVGLVQPGSVKMYNYYNLDEQCTRFYHPSKGSPLFNKICHGDVCRCAEESCSLLNKVKEDFNLQMRTDFACKPGVDYVYKTKLIRTKEDNGYYNYFMKILDVIKAGTDPNPAASPRMFISPMKCRESLHLQENKDYLIWGLSADMWPTKDTVNYLISKDTWIERWPDDDECQEEEFENLCNDLIQFSNILNILGCQT
ncbi:A.superbus venom factor 1 isoform X1 [Pogona vitticeps]